MEGTEGDSNQGPSRTDYAYSMIRGIVASIPFAGSLLSEVGSTAIPSPAQRRLNRWMRSISERLATLESTVSGFSVDGLGNNPAFAVALGQAVQMASQEADNAKLEALRNAVLNSALPGSVEVSRQQMFIGMVGSLTPLHLQILSYLGNPREAFTAAGIEPQNYSSGSLYNQLVVLRPDLESEREIVNAIVSDLYGRRLIPMDSIQGGITGAGLLSSPITELGRAFLSFITSP